MRAVRPGGWAEVPSIYVSVYIYVHLCISISPYSLLAGLPPSVETASRMSIVVFARDGATEIGLRARDSDENRTRACSMDLLPHISNGSCV